MEINCKFELRYLSVETIYCCLVTSTPLNDDYLDVNAFKATHFPNKIDDDVEAFRDISERLVL